jgi:restriction system protein
VDERVHRPGRDERWAEELRRLRRHCQRHLEVSGGDREADRWRPRCHDLEEFLVQNWASTDLGKEYDIFEEDGEQVGQQYPTDTGPIDVLAIRKDRKELLVLELKKGRASDAVVGQVLRYMGYALQELAEDDQTVRGVIIALEDDQRLRRALAATSNIAFYRYQVNFKLMKA